ncbi:hypothetical protein EXN66_Car018652 [Channa argus]|uniref:Uncharacterized protein n=1 Tax=Channa argus TaxID=215402 RepID=A0A6G1QKH3_CHAAH|nr:hypothetical protein EXN66_Car018652 [Channa argus]
MTAECCICNSFLPFVKCFEMQHNKASAHLLSFHPTEGIIQPTEKDLSPHT